MKFNEAAAFLMAGSTRTKSILSWDEWREFKRNSKTGWWVYLYGFTNERLAWGTTSLQSDRIRKSSLFHSELSGKNDRRVDYLMLKEIHGAPRVQVFETDDATGIESDLRREIGPHSFSYSGFPGIGRREVSLAIVDEFRLTAHYISLTITLREKFEEYLETVYFRSQHPFKFGDTLEPAYIRNYPALIPGVEAALRVQWKPRLA